MLMDEAEAARLPLPPKPVLLAYARRAFALAEQAVDAVDDPLFRAPDTTATAVGRAATVGDAILAHLVHDNRHLGEIECLRGLQGLSGTATR